jgi:hypothetical protein
MTNCNKLNMLLVLGYFYVAVHEPLGLRMFLTILNINDAPHGSVPEIAVLVINSGLSRSSV